MIETHIRRRVDGIVDVERVAAAIDDGTRERNRHPARTIRKEIERKLRRDEGVSTLLFLGVGDAPRDDGVRRRDGGARARPERGDPGARRARLRHGHRFTADGTVHPARISIEFELERHGLVLLDDVGAGIRRQRRARQTARVSRQRRVQTRRAGFEDVRLRRIDDVQTAAVLHATRLADDFPIHQGHGIVEGKDNHPLDGEIARDGGLVVVRRPKPSRRSTRDRTQRVVPTPLRLTKRAVVAVRLSTRVHATIAAVPTSVAVIQTFVGVAHAVSHALVAETRNGGKRGPRLWIHGGDVRRGHRVHGGIGVGEPHRGFRHRYSRGGAHEKPRLGIIPERGIAHAHADAAGTQVSRDGDAAGGDVGRRQRRRRLVHDDGVVVTPTARFPTHESVGGAARAAASPP